MSKIEEIILENYQNSSSLINMIRQYNFEYFLNGTLKEIEIAITNSDSKKLSELATISLIKINENLKGINKKEKGQLEYLLSDIFQAILLNIDSEEILYEIQKTLLNTCQLPSYNYTTLEQLLGLKKQKILKPRQIQGYLPYYEWKGLDYELIGILDFLFDKKIIYNKKAFRRIFTPIDDHFDYKGNKDKISDLVLIFSILKEKILIKPKRNSGHFAPLVKYGVDNDGNYLFQKAPNKIHEYMKRDTSVYRNIRDKYEQIVNNITKKTLRQWVDNGQSPQKL